MDMSLARAQQAAPPEESFADSLFAGLAKAPKEIACKYFYDQEGSQLFERICTLPEYYQTRTETLLLATHAEEIAQLMGEDIEVVEFGAGASQKVRILLDTGHVCAYSPLDISGDYLREVVLNLASDYPALTLRPLIGDFTRPLEIPALIGPSRRAGFFPGSTIGNFRPDAAMCLLRRMRGMLEGGGLLIGVDLVKDPARLHAAYNDRAGVTALFNKNLLRPLCALQPCGPPHRDVSGQPQAPERVLDGPAFRFCRRRSHPYRGQPQIHDRVLPRDGGARRLPAASGMDRSRAALFAALAGELKPSETQSEQARHFHQNRMGGLCRGGPMQAWRVLHRPLRPEQARRKSGDENDRGDDREPHAC